ncbi:MAG TPA: RICIN domain-containing protein [Chlamydiales bacterium]|jgi:hypothetical protein|nr:RICIN domain-containing protein [Chlamydiales bacterium]
MFSGEGVYWIRNKSPSTKFFDVRSKPYVHGGERPSMPIGLFSSRLIRPQLWLVEQVPDGETFVFRNFDTGTVLDIKDGSSTQGTPIVLNAYNDTGENVSSQHWKIVWDSDEKKYVFYFLWCFLINADLQDPLLSHHQPEDWDCCGPNHEY